METSNAYLHTNSVENRYHINLKKKRFLEYKGLLGKNMTKGVSVSIHHLDLCKRNEIKITHTSITCIYLLVLDNHPA